MGYTVNIFETLSNVNVSASGTNVSISTSNTPVTVSYNAVELDGVNVQTANISSGNLLLTLSNASVIDAGQVVGPQGVQGPQGPQGSQGLQGIAGPQGPTGAQGPQGLQGIAGPQGPTGTAGSQGPQGPAGAAGPQGPQGPIGATGSQGPQGPQGVAGTSVTLKGAVQTVGDLPSGAAVGDLYVVVATGDGYVWDGAEWDNAGPIRGPSGPIGPSGVQGPQGPIGATGVQGPQGPIGPIGNTGPQGPQGPIGPQGPQGPAGPQGEQGISGPQGSQGPTGPIGNTGPQGPQGEIGPIGNTGPQGPQGPIGPIGNTGPQGPQGPAGPIGNTGPQGPQGEIGPIGNTGPQGPQGPIGAAGAQGPQGPAGAAGSQGPQGPAGVAGPQGPQGPIGATGGQGPQGPQGPAGPQGDAGPQGPQGPIGATGPQGPQGPSGALAGSNFVGAFTYGGTYAFNDIVEWTGSTFVMVNPAGTYTDDPNNDTTNWKLVGTKGNDGSEGPQGPQGPAGAAGDYSNANVYSYLTDNASDLTTTTVYLGNIAGLTQIDAASANLTIQSATGNINMASTDAVNLYGARLVTTGNVEALYFIGDGSQLTNLPGGTGPQGPQGPQGDAGPQGPQGPQGDAGPQGPQGPQGTFSGVFTANVDAARYTLSNLGGLTSNGTITSNATLVSWSDAGAALLGANDSFLPGSAAGGNPTDSPVRLNSSYTVTSTARTQAGVTMFGNMVLGRNNDNTGSRIRPIQVTGILDPRGFNSTIGILANTAATTTTIARSPANHFSLLWNNSNTAALSTANSIVGVQSLAGIGSGGNATVNYAVGVHSALTNFVNAANVGIENATAFRADFLTLTSNAAQVGNRLVLECLDSTANIKIAGNIISTAANVVAVGASFNDILFKGFEETTSTLTYAATITPNVANATIQTVTLTGNVTFNGFENPLAGQSLTLIVIQDGTGNRTLTSNMKFTGGSKTLSTAANAQDIISVFYTGTTYYASLTKGYA